MQLIVTHHLSELFKVCRSPASSSATPQGPRGYRVGGSTKKGEFAVIEPKQLRTNFRLTPSLQPYVLTPGGFGHAKL